MAFWDLLVGLLLGSLGLPRVSGSFLVRPGAFWVLLAWGLLGPPGALGAPWGLLLLHLVPPLAPLGTSWELLEHPLRLSSVSWGPLGLTGAPPGASLVPP